MTINWNQRTWRIAWPIMLSNISVPLLGAVDMAVVGRLPGPQYIGAVAVGALIFTVILHGFIFLRMGTTGLTAQALGARKPDEVRAWLARSGLLAFSIGLGLIVLQTVILWVALELVGPADDVSVLVDDYFSIRIWGAPAALCNFALTGWFFGIQNSRAALVMQIFMNGLNIVLDIWFVWGLGWGVAGVAWATLISEISAVFVGFVLVHHNLQTIGGAWVKERILDAERMQRMVRVNGDIFIRSICLQIGFAAIAAIGARIGSTTLAANAILFNFVTFAAYFLDGFSHAAEALAGEAVGARNPGAFRNAVAAAKRGALIAGAGLTAALWLFGPDIINLMTTVSSVREAALTYLPWVMAMPMVSVWSFLLDGIFIGATWTREMRNGMIIAVLIYACALGILVPLWGNHGIWAAVTIFFIARALTLYRHYPRLVRELAQA